MLDIKRGKKLKDTQDTRSTIKFPVHLEGRGITITLGGAGPQSKSTN